MDGEIAILVVVTEWLQFSVYVARFPSAPRLLSSNIMPVVLCTNENIRTKVKLGHRDNANAFSQ